MREAVELFGETLRYDDEQSDRDTLIWQGPAFRLLHHRYFDHGSAMWSLSAEGPGLFRESYDHATVAEAAQELATTLMREHSEAAARRIARRILAGLSSELNGGER